MKVGYCESCGKETEFKRQFGLGFYVGVVLTAGLWLLTIPLAPLRCTECGSEQKRRSDHFTRDQSVPPEAWD